MNADAIRVEARCALCGRQIPDTPPEKWMEHEDGRLFCSSEHLVKAIRIDDEWGEMVSELTALKEENVRLRETLERLLPSPVLPGDMNFTTKPEHVQAANAARAALAGHPLSKEKSNRER